MIEEADCKFVEIGGKNEKAVVVGLLPAVLGDFPLGKGRGHYVCQCGGGRT